MKGELSTLLDITLVLEFIIVVLKILSFIFPATTKFGKLLRIILPGVVKIKEQFKDIVEEDSKEEED
jgi:hypothetical protein